MFIFKKSFLLLIILSAFFLYCDFLNSLKRRDQPEALFPDFPLLSVCEVCPDGGPVWVQIPVPRQSVGDSGCLSPPFPVPSHHAPRDGPPRLTVHTARQSDVCAVRRRGCSGPTFLLPWGCLHPNSLTRAHICLGKAGSRIGVSKTHKLGTT